MTQLIWTIGHSTKPIEDFLNLLMAQGIQCLVDVRTVPRSRHNPQFNTDALACSLAKASVSYRHSAELGGLRKANKDSINTGWRNAGFRGYADYMHTEAFWNALDELITESRRSRTAIMCAEDVPRRCHRSMVADALATRGWTVKHILSPTKADTHVLTPFALVEQGRITYPAPNDPDAPRLF